MAVNLVDDLSDLQIGALIDRVPEGMNWLLRSCPPETLPHEDAFFAHVYDHTTETNDGIGISFKAYADAPEEALRQALRAMRKADTARRVN
jgi:hypothetical protein